MPRLARPARPEATVPVAERAVSRGGRAGALEPAARVAEIPARVVASGVGGESAVAYHSPMKRWIDLDELRRDIAAEAKARALAAGLEGARTVRR